MYALLNLFLYFGRMCFSVEFDRLIDFYDYVATTLSDRPSRRKPIQVVHAKYYHGRIDNAYEFSDTRYDVEGMPIPGALSFGVQTHRTTKSRPFDKLDNGGQVGVKLPLWNDTEKLADRPENRPRKQRRRRHELHHALGRHTHDEWIEKSHVV